MKKKFKTMSKRTLAILLTFVMLLTAVPIVGITAFAKVGDVAQSGDFYYEVLPNNTAKIISYIGDETDVIVPSEIYGYTVTSVVVSSFYNYGVNMTITIPATVSEIISEYMCSSVEAVNVAEDNPYLRSENGIVFSKDKTELICYPGAKEDESYTVPSTVTKLGRDVTFGQYTRNITFPASLVSIDVSKECDFGQYVENITVDKSNPKYSSIDGVLFEKIDSGLKLLRYPAQREVGIYDIPKGTLSIADFAFEGVGNFNIKINIPSSVTEITFNSFNPYAVNESEISTYGGDYGWEYGITDILVDSANTVYSSQDGVLFNKNMTELVYYPCSNPRTFYEIPAGVVYVDNFAVSSYLRDLVVPKSVKDFGDNAFAESFVQCVCYVGSKAEWNNIKIGSNNKALRRAKKLYNWNGVGCYYNVLDDGTAEIVGYCGPEKDILIPAEIDGYTVSAIADGAFAHNKAITSVVVSDGIKTIGNNAFVSCTSLRSVKLPSTLTSIGTEAFEYCIEMTECNLPDSITSIGDGAFLTCVKLEHMSVPKGMTKIEDSTFAECNGLIDIKIPVGITSIGRGAFSSCRGLTDVYYEGTEEQWNAIDIDNSDPDWNNDDLLSANIHYNWKDETHTHSYTETITKEATCKEEGVKTFTCSCGDSYTEAIPATGHQNLKDITVPATCKVQGLKYTICTDCGEQIGESEVLPVIPHNCKKVTTKDATCTEAGVISLVCEMCNETISTEEIPALGHDFGEWVVTKEPTEAEEGLEIRHCSRCDATEENILPRLPQSVKDEQSGIAIDAPSGSYDGKLEMNVEEQFDGESFQIINGMDGVSQSKVYDITTTVDGEKVQPVVPVTVRIPLPEGYNPERTYVYHINSETGEVENMNARVENGYLVFETDHFSIYAVVEEAEPEKDYGLIGNILKAVIDFVVKVVKIVIELLVDLWHAIF